MREVRRKMTLLCITFLNFISFSLTTRDAEDVAHALTQTDQSVPVHKPQVVLHEMTLNILLTLKDA